MPNKLINYAIILAALPPHPLSKRQVGFDLSFQHPIHLGALQRFWELESVFDDKYCHRCEGETKLAWSQADHPPHKRIREMNDLFRTTRTGNGTVLITNGIQGEGHEFIVSVVDAVRTFANFNNDNEPWGEHDFAAIEVESHKV